MSELRKMDPTMATQLVRDELDNKSDSAGDYIYHLLDSRDDDMDISDSDTDIIPQ